MTTPKHLRPRCNNCLAHGFYVYKDFNIVFTNEDNKYTTKLECIDCGTMDDVTWEEYSVNSIRSDIRE